MIDRKRVYERERECIREREREEEGEREINKQKFLLWYPKDFRFIFVGVSFLSVIVNIRVVQLINSFVRYT